MNNKIVLGQFFTKDSIWLKPQVVDFIKNSNCTMAYDPFAGEGHLLNSVKNLGIDKIKGLDIDPSLGWQVNDSLIEIPKVNNALIITNPPYLTNYSASRKKIIDSVKKYFDNSCYDDLYLIALDKMLKASNNVIAIIPETFINSNFKQKNLLNSITILEENPFDDTDTPVIVACFDSIKKDYSKIEVYKNSTKINNLRNIENTRLTTKNDVKIKFNDVNGWLAVRCVDTTKPNDMLKFDFKENIDYDWEKRIKVSSRLLTLISIDISLEDRKKYVDECNLILNDLRFKSGDIIFSPFKGNMKNGKRRRRLDFYTCRAIMEIAYHNLFSNKGEKDGK